MRSSKLVVCTSGVCTSGVCTFVGVIGIIGCLAAGLARAGEPPPPATPAATAAEEVTLKGTLGCGKCSFHEAKACENVLKVGDGAQVETYLLADNAVSQANHEKVCGPAAPATVTGTVSAPSTKPGAKRDRRKLLTASRITFE
jgi:hypothetical protein